MVINMKKRIALITCLLSFFLADLVLATSSTTNITTRLTTALPSTTVQVFSLADFPVPIAGVITLNAGEAYQIIDAVDIGTNRIIAMGNSVFGVDPFNDSLTSSNTGDCFTGVDASMLIQNMTFNCANGRAFNFKNTAGSEKTSIFSAEGILIITKDVGIFENLSAVGFFDGGSFGTVDSGITFAGSQNGGFATRFWDTSNVNGSGALFDFGTAVFEDITITNTEFVPTATSVFIKGAVGNANLISGSRAIVVNNPIKGGLTPNLSGVSTTDSGWFFFDNNGLADSVGGGDGIYSGNGTIPTSTVATITDTFTLNGGKVGIGITPNQGTLQIKQNSDNSVGGITLEDLGGVDILRIYHDGNNLHVENAGNANQLLLGSNGNVGMGVAIPDTSTILDLVSTTRGFGIMGMTNAQILAITSPKPGLTVYSTDDNFNYQYDSSRSKWLSSDTTTYQFGSNGSTDNTELNFNSTQNSTSGVLTPRNGTVISVTGMQNSGNTTKGFEVRSNGINIFAYTLVASEFISNTVDADFTAADMIHVFSIATGSAASNPTATVTVKWRL